VTSARKSAAKTSTEAGPGMRPAGEDRFVASDHPETELFIRQDIRSDYCAVYATGMCLSLAGMPTSRKDARELFGARAHWPGASHSQIRLAVQRRHPDFNGRWRHLKASSGREVYRALELAVGAGSPVLVTAYCRHRALRITCGHAFVATQLTGAGIGVLDSLSGKPGGRACHNAIIVDGNVTSRWVRVVGAPWDISVLHPVSFLRVPHTRTLQGAW
jgi:hypothetical protein